MKPWLERLMIKEMNKEEKQCLITKQLWEILIKQEEKNKNYKDFCMKLNKKEFKMKIWLNKWKEMLLKSKKS